MKQRSRSPFVSEIKKKSWRMEGENPNCKIIPFK